MSGALYRLAERIYNVPLLITPEKLLVISALLANRMGIDASDLDTEALGLNKLASGRPAVPRGGAQVSALTGT